MSFLDNVPTYINDLSTEVEAMEKERRNIDWGHECDCQYCTRQGEGDDEAEEHADQIDKDVKARKVMIRRLYSYAQMFDTKEAK